MAVEKETSTSKNMVAALMEAIVDGIITIDEKGTIHSLNPATQRIFGYEKEELIGQNVKMLMPEPYKSEHDGYLDNYHNTGHKKIIGIGREVLGQRKNGEIFPLELAVNDMYVDGKPMFAGIVRDISERKRVEDALIASNKRLELATEASGAGVWEYDVENDNLVWDDQMFKIYGIEKSAFTAVYNAWTQSVHPEDLPKAEKEFLHTVKTGEPFDSRFRIVWPDGSEHYIEAHAQVIMSHKNQVQRVIGVNTDVSDAKSVEFEYQARENRIRALMDTIVDGIIVINDQGRILTMNPAAEKLFGYQQSDIQLKNIKMLMPDPYSSAHDGYLKNYRNTGVKKIIGIGREVVGLRRDGSTFPMELAVSEAVVSGETLFTGIVRDISERKRVFDQLNLQSGALEAAANAILITNELGEIEWVNSAFTPLTGYLPDEVVGKTTRILKSGKQSPAFYKELWKTVNEGRVWQGEMINKRKDGSLYIEEQTITPVVDNNGKINHFIAIKLDISERKEAEAALAEKNEALALIAEYERTQSKIISLFNTYSDESEIFSLVLDILADSHQLHLSGVFLFNEWQGMLSCVASHGFPENLERNIEIGKGLIGQAALSDKQLVIEGKEGSPYSLDVGLFSIQPTTVVINPIFYSSKAQGVLVVASLNKLEAAELAFIDKLAKQVGVSLNSLNQYQNLKTLSEQLKLHGKEISLKNTQLEQSNRLKTEFLANMSHELRTPLNAIIGFSEVLKDKLLGDLNEEQDDYICEIYHSANHLLSLINDILDLSKIEAGKMDLSLEVHDLPDMLKNAVSIIKERAHNHRISVSIEIDKTIKFVKVDGRKFKQILFNLLSNAVKFTQDGGKITLKAERDNHKLTVSVIDSGIGISDEKKEFLFQPFVQLDGSLSRHYEGTGLGLAMVKRLVELHKGEIELESKEGEGSCFRFSIPYIEDNELNVEQGSPPTTAPSPRSNIIESEKKVSQTGNSILLIEENLIASNQLLQKLKGEGYSVHHEAEDSDVCAIAMSERPDLIMLDFSNPTIKSWDIVKKLKQYDQLKSIPIMSISPNRMTGIKLGRIDVLEKPITNSKMINLLHRHLPDYPDPTDQILIISDEENTVLSLLSQLKDSGYETQSASDISLALKITENITPALIIVELSMSEPSGFEVISALRQSINSTDIPIIVLIENSISEEKRLHLSEIASKVMNKCGVNTPDFFTCIRETVSVKITENRPTRLAKPKADKISLTNSNTSPLILIIENDQAQAELLKLYLEDSGYRVNLANNAREGIDIMQHTRPDLITVDLLFSELDTKIFFETKKAMPEYANIPVMALSSARGSSDVDAVIADAVLTKPVQRSEVISLVNNLVAMSDTPDKHNFNILLIDDDPKAIKIVKSYLQGNHFNVGSALGGRDGLKLVKTEAPDLIILDLMMPEMSGFEVLNILKRNEETKKIPVIVLTAKILTNEDRKLLSNQVAAIAEKGRVDKKSLSNEIDKILKRYSKP